MVRDLWNEILEGVQVRQALSKLRQEVKEEGAKLALLYQIGINYQVLEELLSHEDPKVRKNTALLIGDLQIQALLDPLFKAYEAEDTLFVKSSYLTALESFDYGAYLPALKLRLEQLSQMELTEENKKHIAQESRAISDLILGFEGMEPHTFTGYKESSDLVLLTNRNHIDVTSQALEGMNAKPFGAGVMVRTNKLEDVLAVRTIQEILFVVPGMGTCSNDPEEAAKTIVDAGFVTYLSKRHAGQPPFYVRIELKSKMPLDKKSTFTKRMGAALERLSDRRLINSTSNYEVELRLIENKEGTFHILVKLYTLKDERFAYRKEVEPTSIRPVNAALTVALVKEYLKEGAQVLDPFCGVGTMLIERHKCVKANTTYGIDLLASAIDKAKTNTEAARQIIHYINKDFFEFRHEYRFDEIITNFPMAIGSKTETEIYDLYEQFFAKARGVLADDAVMIVYSHNRDCVKRLAPKYNVRIEKEFELSKKEGTYVFVLKYRA